MELLDAVGAFALTLAGLATVVTILLEVAHRALGMRRRNLARIMNMLVGEMGIAGKTVTIGQKSLSAEEAWEFVRATLNNPAVSVPAIPDVKEVGTLGIHPPATCRDRVLLLVAHALGFLGHNRSKLLIKRRRDARAAANPQTPGQWKARLGELETVNLRAGVYDKVSVEHVLRRLLEIEEVKKAARAAPALVEEQLNLLVRKFEEFSSSVSADFKRRSQTYSILIGIALALVANVDGLRVFNAYLNNPKAAQNVLAQTKTLEAAHSEATESYEKTLKAITGLSEKITELKATIPTGIVDAAAVVRKRKIEAEIDDLEKQRAALSGPQEIAKTIERAKGRISSLAGVGIPIGGDYYPHCGSDISEWVSDMFGKKNSLQTCSRTAGDDTDNAFLKWLVSAIVTGMLIGLGAPFWFDVAKRVAEVRAMFGGKGSAEARLSGKDADANPNTRRDIVKNVLADAGVKVPGENPGAAVG